MEKNSINIAILLQLLIVILFGGCKDASEKKIEIHDGYSIEGKIIENAQKVFLLNTDNEKIDSTNIEKNNFVLKGKVSTANLFYLQIDNNETKHPIVLENSMYYVIINEKKEFIVGGELNTKLVNYQHLNSEYHKEHLNYYQDYLSKDLSLKNYLKLVDSLKMKEHKVFTDFIVNNKNTILSSIVLNQKKLLLNDAINLQEIIRLSDNKTLIEDVNNITAYLKKEAAAKKVLRRKPVPLFSGINLSGSKSYLKPLIRGKKLFLIDFWASWCPPCRATSPKIKKLYKKYYKKGFDVLTVSEDRSVNEWRNGVFADGIETWHHIYDDYNRISSMFGVTSLPHLVLIDEKGRIIKNKISIKNLEIELKKVFNE